MKPGLENREEGESSKDEEDEYDYFFVCNSWLANNEDDGEIVREIVPYRKSGLNSILSGMILFTT